MNDAQEKYYICACLNFISDSMKEKFCFFDGDVSPVLGDNGSETL